MQRGSTSALVSSLKSTEEKSTQPIHDLNYITVPAAAFSPNQQELKQTVLDWTFATCCAASLYMPHDMFHPNRPPTMKDNVLVLNGDTDLHSFLHSSNNADDLEENRYVMAQKLERVKAVNRLKQTCADVYNIISNRQCGMFMELVNKDNAAIEKAIMRELSHAFFMFRDEVNAITFIQLTLLNSNNTHVNRLFIQNMYEESIKRGLPYVFKAILSLAKEPNMSFGPGNSSVIHGTLLAHALFIIEELAVKLSLTYPTLPPASTLLHSKLMAEFDVTLNGISMIVSELMQNGANVEEGFVPTDAFTLEMSNLLGIRLQGISCKQFAAAMKDRVQNKVALSEEQREKLRGIYEAVAPDLTLVPVARAVKF